jgi:hypothetical protein
MAAGATSAINLLKPKIPMMSENGIYLIKTLII